MFTVIDPLDGTTNFISNACHTSFPLLRRIKGRTEVAVVYDDPMRNELFTATRGQGAQRLRLRGSTARDLTALSSPPASRSKPKQYATTYINIIGKRRTECADFRRTGSAAALIWPMWLQVVSMVSFEISWPSSVDSPRALLVCEAGGIVSDYRRSAIHDDRHRGGESARR
ncbi:hypothetical protein KCP73_19985 [Salmonella enterica subsp. enterica]|nr:hypothetical protein KCP73_19985 [Salmonella enterica subsp. enterica]